ncbi:MULTISPECIES: helix-turn-helix domain-containing protein [unclassified Gilliamella]|uniref:helix-turn-helix domain-containing protein n=1 Tax=unclassified Gilliamella TaxID=2685620 RepID=UPI002269EF87|nr:MULTISPECIES: helix-turn-helix domain-containing protein [unclassified Gilliamella]MCX8641728.1 hypothetical protein [Gilliamella sp. B3835]MCX8706529.1 hypothetical protein [Gilliamella sp. B3783]MCX8709001.1 hypothetical protein [Gilliamella sp. B3780]MCX8714501.1 hypothetical protein [Gilliamella sp. B3781]MCX8715867.1 hypothetical protein [Gilliamella sp. B3784]
MFLKIVVSPYRCSSWSFFHSLLTQYLTVNFKDSDSPSTTLKDKVKNYEKELIINALKRHNGHRETTANSLGVSKRTLLYKMQEYKIFEKKH